MRHEWLVDAALASWPSRKSGSKAFSLGTSDAKPARGYFADAAGLQNEQEHMDAIAGLSSEEEIEEALARTLSLIGLRVTLCVGV